MDIIFSPSETKSAAGSLAGREYGGCSGSSAPLHSISLLQESQIPTNPAFGLENHATRARLPKAMLSFGNQFLVPNSGLSGARPCTRTAAASISPIRPGPCPAPQISCLTQVCLDKARQLGAPGHPNNVGRAGMARPSRRCAARGTLGADGPSGAQSRRQRGRGPGLAGGAAGLEGRAAAGKEEDERRLLLVVLFAVQFPIPEVAAGGEGLLTRRALQTLLVPGRLVDSHQEAVRDGPLAALADGGMRAVGACSAQGESRAVSADQPACPGIPAARCRQPRLQGRRQPGRAARRLRSPGCRAKGRAASASWSQSADSGAERPRASSLGSALRSPLLRRSSAWR